MRSAKRRKSLDSGLRFWKRSEQSRSTIRSTGLGTAAHREWRKPPASRTSMGRLSKASARSEDGEEPRAGLRFQGLLQMRPTTPREKAKSHHHRFIEVAGTSSQRENWTMPGIGSAAHSSMVWLYSDPP